MKNTDFKKTFGALLEETIFPSDVNNEEYYKKILPIDNLVKANIPSKLFRYRSCNELNIDSFDKDTIWAVNPSKFNDPYDSLFFADRNILYEKIRDSYSIKFRQDLCLYYEEHKSLPDIFQKIFGDELVKVLERKLSQITFSEIKDVEETPPSFDQFSKVVDEVQNSLRNTTKITCLSERIDNSLMWAHYADYHKGFALEYDFSNNQAKCKCDNCDIKAQANCSQRQFVKLYPVIYSDKQYNATYFVDWYIAYRIAHSLGAEFSYPKPDSLYTEKIYLNKSNIWAYECEWRLICDCRNNLGTDSMMLENHKPTAIYYGAQISSINKKILMKLCENKEIKQYEMFIDYDTDNYELKMKQI